MTQHRIKSGSFLVQTGKPGKNHVKAQERIANLLRIYYRTVVLEQEVPIPTPFLKYDKSTHEYVPYRLDVYATVPKFEYLCKYKELGIEIYGDVGHKHTRRQYKKDYHRNVAIKNYYGITISVYDTEDLVGRGHKIRKTLKFKPLFTNDDILKDLAIGEKY